MVQSVSSLTEEHVEQEEQLLLAEVGDGHFVCCCFWASLFKFGLAPRQLQTEEKQTEIENWIKLGQAQ